MPKGQHMPGYRPIPIMLKAMRENAHFTQRELAKKMKRGQPFIHKSEVGERRVDCYEFAQWCKACGVEPVGAFGDLISQYRHI